MRLVTYRGEAGERAGVDTDDGVFDAAALLGEQSASVRGLIAQDRVGELHERLEGGFGAIDPIPAPELLPPITDPEKIVCIGLNYRSHAAEAGIEPPADPTFFAKFRNAPRLTGRNRKVARGEREGRLRGGDRVRDWTALQGDRLRRRSTRSRGTRSTTSPPVTSSSPPPSGCQARSSMDRRRAAWPWSPRTRRGRRIGSPSRST